MQHMIYVRFSTHQGASNELGFVKREDLDGEPESRPLLSSILTASFSLNQIYLHSSASRLRYRWVVYVYETRVCCSTQRDTSNEAGFGNKFYHQPKLQIC